MKLKKQINKLSGELAILKAKFEVNEKRSLQKNKKIDMEF